MNSAVLIGMRTYGSHDCEYCGVEFIRDAPIQRYHSPECMQKAKWKRHAERQGIEPRQPAKPRIPKPRMKWIHILHCPCGKYFTSSRKKKHHARECRPSAYQARPIKTDIGYSAAHMRVKKARGIPVDCEHCGRSDGEARDYHWAVDWRNARVLYTDGKQTSPQGKPLLAPYSLDVNDYLRLCASCHGKYDQRTDNDRELVCIQRG